MIRTTAKHAVAALTAIADVPEGTYAGAREIAAEIRAPRDYLGKLLKTLAHHGSKVRDAYLEFLGETTIADLVARAKSSSGRSP